MHERGLLRDDFVEIFRVQRINEMNFSAQEAQDFDVAILLDIEADRINVGQLMSGGVVLPVVRVALEV